MKRRGEKSWGTIWKTKYPNFTSIILNFFTNQLGFGGFSIISQSPIYQQVVIFSDSAFDGVRCSFVSIHLSTSFSGKQTFQFKWQPRYFYLPLLGYIISYMSDFLLSYFISTSSNQISLNETIEMIGRQELPYFLLIACFIGPIAEELIYRGVLMTTFFKKSPWYGDVLLSAIIFGLYSYQFRFNSSCFFHLC